MKKIIGIALLFGNLFATDIQINSGWNMLGVSSDTPSSSFVTNSNEVAYTYIDGTWSKYDTTHSGTIKAGSGFWLYSSGDKTTAISSSASEQEWVQGWNLVSPARGAWSIKDNFPTVSYGWRWEAGSWKLYDKAMTSGNYGFETLASIDIGEGVWVKSEHNGKLGNRNILLSDGQFGVIKSSATTAQNQSQLIDDVRNQFNISFQIDESKSTLSNFLIWLRMTRVLSGETSEDIYHYVVSSPLSETSDMRVGIKKNDEYEVGIYLLRPISYDLQTKTIKLDLGAIVNGIINSGEKSYEEMKNRFAIKSTYKIEVLSRNISILGSKTLVADETYNSSKTFLISNSNKFEGSLNIQ